MIRKNENILDEDLVQEYKTKFVNTLNKEGKALRILNLKNQFDHVSRVNKTKKLCCFITEEMNLNKTTHEKKDIA